MPTIDVRKEQTEESKQLRYKFDDSEDYVQLDDEGNVEFCTPGDNFVLCGAKDAQHFIKAIRLALATA